MAGMKPALAACLSSLVVALPISSRACGSLGEMLAVPLIPEPSTRELFANPLLRLNLGGSWLVGQGQAPSGQFEFDLNGGAILGWPHQGGEENSMWLLPEVGYSWRPAMDGQNANLGLFGLGIGYGCFSTAIVVYTPRFVAGTFGQDTSLGFRHGISVHILWSAFSLELSHQVMSASSQLSHEILLTLGINPLGPLPVYRFLRTSS